MDNKENLKDIFDFLMGAKVPSSRLNGYVKANFGEELTNAELVCIGQILKAQNERDTKAAEFVRDTMGQKPTDKKEIAGTNGNPFVVKLDGKLAEWAE